MKRTFWLASYPKSGNTWLRLLIASYLAPPNHVLSINDPLNLGSMATARWDFDYATLIDSSLLTHEEAELIRPRVHAAYELGLELRDDDEEPNDRVRFDKTHDAYLKTAAGEAVLAGALGAAGAIVIVRDPRDIVSSLAHHLGLSIDQAIEFIGDENAAISSRNDCLHRQLRQNLGTWSRHVYSWLEQTDIPTCLVRYEDILTDPPLALARAMRFAGILFDQDRLDRAAAFTAFDRLREQEQESGFREAPRTGPFFRRGQAGAWRNELTKLQVEQIERDHGPMMRRLGYIQTW